MSFLSPLFFVALGAIAVPILVHLIQRERHTVVDFPSLMFLRRIPYQSVRRRRVRHWYLLLMRAVAILLLVSAFARPFFSRGAAASVVGGGASREVVILLDQSASMGYGDQWDRARAAARGVVAAIGPTDRASLVLFARNAEENMRATSDRGRLDAAIDSARVTSGATRYGPALKLAESILARSTLPRREAVLISDFQKSGWTGAEDVQFTAEMTLTTVSVGSERTANLSVPSLNFARAEFSNQERITVTAGVANRGADSAAGVPVSLEVDGHQLETKPVTIGPNAASSVSFAPFTLARTPVRGTVRAGTDALAADNAFHFVLAPAQPLSVLVVEGGDRSSASFYLSRALGIGTAPVFKTEVTPAGRVSPSVIERHSVVVLNDTAVPPGVGVTGLARFVENGGGLLVVLGDRSTWPAGEADLLPGKPGATIDRTGGRGATLGSLDYGHPVFEVFKAPRSGDFSAARVQRYRSFEIGPDARVLARFDDGAAAVVERRVGSGRVIVWSTSLDDSWNDLALKPVYLPFVHQVVKYLARYEQASAWLTVGQVVDLSSALKGRADRVVVTPTSEQIKVTSSDSGLIELGEQGIYEVRSGGSGEPYRVAVNLDPSESDLAPLDPQELVAAVTGRAAPVAGEQAVPTELTPADSERQQGLWWYLLVAGLVLLAAEVWVSNHLSQKERFL